MILFLFELDLTIGLREVAVIKNRSEWLEAIVEKSGAKTNFKESGRHLERPHITLLDRTWIERVFDGEDDQGVPLSARAQDARGIFENHPRDDKCPAIIVLGGLSHSAHLTRSALFFSSKAPRETQI